MKTGVFLARMQPVHKAHLFMIEEALKENDNVLIILGSKNKCGTLRNPFSIELREKLLRACFSSDDNKRLNIITLPDWSLESDKENSKLWGRYLYYNIVSRIEKKEFSLYYYDGRELLDEWFKDTEIYDYITYKLYDRKNIFEGLSATKIRNALLNDDLDYIKKYCPKSVVDNFEILSEEYKRIYKNPKEDYEME